MAKKRKSTKTKPKSRKRVSGMNLGKFSIGETLQKGGGLVLGIVGGMAMQRHMTFIPQKAMGLLQLGAGIMVTHMKNPIISAAGWGLAGAGAGGLATQTGLIHGIDEMVSGVFGEDEMSGYEGYIEGMGNGTTLSGMAGIDQEAYMDGINNGTMLSGYAYDRDYAPMAMGY